MKIMARLSYCKLLAHNQRLTANYSQGSGIIRPQMVLLLGSKDIRTLCSSS